MDFMCTVCRSIQQSCLVESKLTETDFQIKAEEVVEGYRDFKEVFDWKQLDKSKGCYRSYQLIRNVLAAHALNCSFCVCLDRRRPDLLEHWYAVMRRVKGSDLKTRCKVLTWQELSSVVPAQLRTFLDIKYGIAPPGTAPSRVPGVDGRFAD